MEELRLDSDEKEFIHDDPSPRGVLEIPVMNGDSDTSSSSSFSSCSTTEKSSTPKHESNREGYGLQWRNMIDTIKKKSARRFSIIPLLTTYENRKNLRRRMAKLAVSEDEVQTASLSVAKPSWRNFSFEELAAATDNFSPGTIPNFGYRLLQLLFLSVFLGYQSFFFSLEHAIKSKVLTFQPHQENFSSSKPTKVRLSS